MGYDRQKDGIAATLCRIYVLIREEINQNVCDTMNYWKISIERQSETLSWTAIKFRVFPQLGLAFQPCLAGSRIIDSKCRVFSAYIQAVDEKPTSMPWGSEMAFGQPMSEFGGSGTGGWVRGVSFSARGNSLAWVSHDSIVAVANMSKSAQVSTLETEFLPLLSVSLVSEKSTAAAGHDCCPGSLTGMTVAAHPSCPN